jgi:ferredoxin-NADP reductase
MAAARLPIVTLLAKDEVALDTMSFRFDKPAGFEYRAGQFADYTLQNPAETDAEGNTRSFSLSSAPHEPYLMATTRMRDSAFKRNLMNSPIGTELVMDAPYGLFTLNTVTQRPAVFLTGGIGITPVRSMVLQALHDNTDQDITVFYSNRRPEEAAFLDEFIRLADANEKLTLVATMTAAHTSRQNWDGETGRISAALLSKYLDDLTTPIFYPCGPVEMGRPIQNALVAAGVDENDIRTEEFTGYGADI